MSEKKYWIMTFLGALFVPPVAVMGTGFVFAILSVFSGPGPDNSDLSNILIIPLVLLPCYLLVRFWRRHVRECKLPDGFLSRYLPIFIAFAYYTLIWLAAFAVTPEIQSLREQFRYPAFLWLAFPFFFLYGSLVTYFPCALVFLYGVVVATVAWRAPASTKGPAARKACIAMAVCLVVMLAVAWHQNDRHQKHMAELQANVLRRDEKVEPVGSEEVRWQDYRPFAEGNLIQSLDEKPTLSFESGYPKLDGATLLFPLYGAVVESLYRGLDEKTVGGYVGFSRTTAAYEHLIHGQIDVFFGLQPSQGQIEEGERNGVSFTLTPIARDAFVFFVHGKNPVTGLTLDQIRAIYQKKIVAWEDVGGLNFDIIPFQRPENSGSQTIMKALVMRDTPLPPPLIEEHVERMGQIISNVAGYRNHFSALGYSFRYYATGMKPNDNIKLLAIDGVAPTPENIRNGTYPFVVDLCAVTTGSESENTRKLIDWCLSDQGQRLIERCGYVGLRGK